MYAARLKFADYEDDIRIALGVSNLELTDDEINTLAIFGKAELEIFEIRPEVTIIDNYLQLALIYFAAWAALPGLKLKLLQIETDHKSTAQRFKNALDTDPMVLFNEGRKYLMRSQQPDAVASSTGETINLFSGSSPSVNVITG